jgi:hypothetical protein
MEGGRAGGREGEREVDTSIFNISIMTTHTYIIVKNGCQIYQFQRLFFHLSRIQILDEGGDNQFSLRGLKALGLSRRHMQTPAQVAWSPCNDLQHHY